MARQIDKLFNAITKDWTAEDWKETPPDQLRYHISEWLDSGGDMSDLFLAVFEFERYMGW